MRKLDLNEMELEILKEIKEGRTEYLKEDSSDKFQNLFFLKKLFGFIEFDVENNEVSNVRLTESGYYYFYPEKLEADIREEVKNWLE